MGSGRARPVLLVDPEPDVARAVDVAQVRLLGVAKGQAERPPRPFRLRRRAVRAPLPPAIASAVRISVADPAGPQTASGGADGPWRAQPRAVPPSRKFDRAAGQRRRRGRARRDESDASSRSARRRRSAIVRRPRGCSGQRQSAPPSDRPRRAPRAGAKKSGQGDVHRFAPRWTNSMRSAWPGGQKGSGTAARRGPCRKQTKAPQRRRSAQFCRPAEDRRRSPERDAAVK